VVTLAEASLLSCSAGPVLSNDRKLPDRQFQTVGANTRNYRLLNSVHTKRTTAPFCFLNISFVLYRINVANVWYM